MDVEEIILKLRDTFPNEEALGIFHIKEKTLHLHCTYNKSIGHKKRDRDLLHMFMDTCLTKVCLCGVREIKAANVFNEDGIILSTGKSDNMPQVKQIEGFCVQTIGTNLRSMWMMESVDPYRTTCNDPLKMCTNFGIEAAHCVLIREFQKITDSVGKIYDSHIDLLAATQTYPGFIMPLNRHGFNKRKKSGFNSLQRATFEEPEAVFFQAAASSECNEISSISDSIMFGRKVPFGTGFPKLLMHDDDYHHATLKKSSRTLRKNFVNVVVKKNKRKCSLDTITTTEYHHKAQDINHKCERPRKLKKTTTVSSLIGSTSLDVKKKHETNHHQRSLTDYKLISKQNSREISLFSNPVPIGNVNQENLVANASCTTIQNFHMADECPVLKRPSSPQMNTHEKKSTRPSSPHLSFILPQVPSKDEIKQEIVDLMLLQSSTSFKKTHQKKMLKPSGNAKSLLLNEIPSIEDIKSCMKSELKE
jgi:hypothetical protein